MTEHYNKELKYIKNNHWKDDKPESRLHGYDLVVEDIDLIRIQLIIDVKPAAVSDF